VHSIKKDRDRYIFSFSTHNNLLISLFSGEPLCFFTNTAPASGEASSFTKTLAQHLERSKLTKIEVADKDKVIYLTFEKMSSYSGEIQHLLICELIPRYENIILTSKNPDEKRQIIDNHKRVTFSQSNYRQILPGIPYIPPPPLERPYIFALSKDEFIGLVGRKLPQTWQEFIRLFSHVPKFLSSVFAPEIPSDEFWAIINNSKQKIALMKMNPDGDGKNVFYDENQKFLSLIEKPDAISFSTVNEAFKYYYKHKCLELQLEQIKLQIIKRLEKRAESLKEKIKKCENKLEEMANAERWRTFGELLKMHLNEIKKGQKEIRVKNYFSPRTPFVTIPLKLELSPLENMQYYFKKYRKAKSGYDKLFAYIRSMLGEVDSIGEKIETVARANSLEEISEFKDELQEEKKKAGKAESVPFRTFTVQTGKTKWRILVGKTSKQNDELTTKFTKPYDWFFHSRIYHGAHVIVQNPEKRESLPQQIIETAASIAAYYSKAKHSTKVPVDYTQVRYVSKPRKAPIGMVIYKNHKTVFVNPLKPESST
jgi:predicted ribosome quality control (RQC) complex YloA/Tae2 family protein